MGCFLKTQGGQSWRALLIPQCLSRNVSWSKPPSPGIIVTPSPKILAMPKTRTLWTASCGLLLSRQHGLVACNGLTVRSASGVPHHRSPPRQWSEGEVEQLQGLKTRGLTVSQCAEALQRSYDSVSMALAYYRQGYRATRRRRYFTPAERAKLTALMKDNKSWHEIKLEFPERPLKSLQKLWAARVSTATKDNAPWVTKYSSPKSWTDEELEILAKSREAGLNVKAVAKQLGRSIRSVEAKLSRTAELTKRIRIRWSPEEDKRALEMREQGLSWAAIGAALNRTAIGCNHRYATHLKYMKSAPAGHV